ncbi:hypothetical protein KEM55_007963, partial [Ascosphaera atra]
MPSKSSLSSLPTSLLASSNDHTNLKVFSAAAPANGYDAPETQNPLTRSPLVPPQTIHTAVIERYLPPSSRLEYDNIFSAGAKSILIDRLNELTPDGGSMVLIYPTKKGVRTFKRDYLGPTLDPVIRRLIVTKGLPCDVASHLGNIFSPTYMDEYEDMKKKVQGICAANTNDQDGTSPDLKKDVEEYGWTEIPERDAAASKLSIGLPSGNEKSPLHETLEKDVYVSEKEALLDESETPFLSQATTQRRP